MPEMRWFEVQENEAHEQLSLQEVCPVVAVVGVEMMETAIKVNLVFGMIVSWVGIYLSYNISNDVGSYWPTGITSAMVLFIMGGGLYLLGDRIETHSHNSTKTRRNKRLTNE